MRKKRKEKERKERKERKETENAKRDRAVANRCDCKRLVSVLRGSGSGERLF